MSQERPAVIGTSVEKREHAGAAQVEARRGRALAAGALLVAILTALLVAGPALNHPLLMDEMEFPSVAQAIVETGKPVYYRGELYPANVGLWHPPLYIVWYAGWMALFGPSTASARAFGLFNLGLTLAAIAAFAWLRWRSLPEGARLRPLEFGVALLVGLGFVATSPLMVRGALLPDIDTQVLPLTLTAFVLLMFELRRRGVREWVYWSAFVGGCLVQLYAKLPTMILLVPTFVAFELAGGLGRRGVLRARVRRSRPRDGGPGSYRLLVVLSRDVYRVIVGPLLVLASLAAALGLLAATWYVLAGLWGVSFSLPFTYLTQSTNNPANQAGSGGLLGVILAELPQRFNYARQWIGLPAFAFVALLIVREFTAPARGLLTRAERVALYTFLGVLFALYMVLRPAPFEFPKYYPPLIPLLGLLAADLLAALLRPGRALVPLALGGGLGALYLGYAFLSPRTAGRDFILEFYTSWPKEALVSAWMTLPLAAALGVALAVALLLRQRVMGLLALAALAVALGWQVNVSWRQARADYSTTYLYGEQSLDDVTAYLRATMPAGALLVAPKDVGFQLQDQWRYYELLPDPREQLALPGVQYLVMREFDYYGNTIRETPEIAAYVQANYELDQRIGSFLVMARRPAP